ncbi:MAG: flagellar FlbD family protein [Clostridia bacterium]
MISVTRLNGEQLYVNAELIETIEATPDTLISFTTGRKMMVLESVEEIVSRIIEYRSKKTTPRVVPKERKKEG